MNIEELLDEIVGNCYDNRIFIRDCVKFYFEQKPDELKEWEEEE